MRSTVRCGRGVVLCLVAALAGCDGGNPPSDGGSPPSDGGSPPSDGGSCDDGVFCNGIERLTTGGTCAPGPAPCDDGVACTTDTCDEATGLCEHALVGECASCRSDCVPSCDGRVCGPDGCGGSCGDCGGTEACVDVAGTCAAADREGTCGAPIPLVAAGTPLVGSHVVTGDTSTGSHRLVPTCNSTSTAVEIVYTFTTTELLGIDARSSDFDTVLSIRSACDDDTPAATVACSDDASPPGDYGSRVATMLPPGTYYLIVDGFDSASYGPYTLDVRFVAGGCVPACDGVYCGGDDGCGGDCGTCGDGLTCRDARCEPTVCEPNCTGRTCGDDGCGGSCGTCEGGQLCVPATGTCEVFASCDHDAPTCAGCAGGEFCGNDCECHDPSDALPDLVMNAERLAGEILFDTLDVSADSCAIVEECVGGTGLRRLLRFSVEAVNQGQATLTVPPPDTRPDLFEFSPCHGHYHYTGFAEYELLDAAGNVVLEGRKQAYCMEDTEQFHEGPNVGCEKLYSCDEQGIQAGWSDLYGNALDCQWLDITDIAPGEYRLRVRLNPGHAFQEVSFGNNDATIPVTIPAP